MGPNAKMETVSLAFRYAEQDYVRALRSHYASRLRLPLDLLAIGIAAGLGLYEIRVGTVWFGIALLGAGVIAALVLISAFTLIPITSFRKQPKFRDQYSLDFSKTGIHFRTAHIDSNLEWSLYTHALIDNNSIILYYGDRQFTVLPIRVFRDSSELQEFEKLLRENVLKIVDKTNRSRVLTPDS